MNKFYLMDSEHLQESANLERCLESEVENVVSLSHFRSIPSGSYLILEPHEWRHNRGGLNRELAQMTRSGVNVFLVTSSERDLIKEYYKLTRDVHYCACIDKPITPEDLAERIKGIMAYERDKK